MDTSVPSVPTPVSIDQMLGSLWEKTQVQPTPSVDPVAQPTLTSSFNIDALAKPIPVVQPTSSLWDHLSEERTSPYARILALLKKLWAMACVVFLLIGSYWFMSVQYPVESKDYTDKVLWLFTTTLAAVRGNMSSSSHNTEDTKLHASAADNEVSDIYNDVGTPLTDSIAQAQTPNTLPTSTEDVFDSALQSTGILDSSTGGTLIDTGSSLLSDDSTLSLSDTNSSDKKTALRDDLILIKEKADTFIAQWATTAVPLKLSIARAVSKKAEWLSLSLEASGADMATIDNDTQQLQLLLQRLSN